MSFADKIVRWYEQNKRDLPWRHSTDPYVIWLSEIILQQTRVDQGLPYFYRFLESYPTIQDFAAASEQEVLKLWQGLGYYSRGRNMLKTAQFIVKYYQGIFPVKYAELLKLKGIGEYTAAAISSFSANEPRAVVDGNVSRVLARYLGIDEPINSTQGKKKFQELANQFLNLEKPALHNQAMMEFGALLCKPKNPDCENCPVRTGCYAYNHQAVQQLPVKLKTVKIKKRYFNYLVIQFDDGVLLKKRKENDIWANMYDFPLIETKQIIDYQRILQSPLIKKYKNLIVITDISPIEKTVLTHQQIYYRFISVKARHSQTLFPKTWFLAKWNHIEKFPMPKIISLLINKIIIL
jgi:A/G-specific adenine glycosylase